MKQQTIIMMGMQGSGKGTQTKLLMQEFQRDAERGVFCFETGSGFRQLAEETHYTGRLVNASLHKGKLQPLFLSIGLWANAFVRNFNGSQHVLIDGFPRVLTEAYVLHTALSYYGLLPATVVSLSVSDEIAHTRMKARGRDDDTDVSIAERIAWYKSAVVPIMAWYKTQPDYRVLEVSGEGDIHDIHRTLLARLN